MSTINDKEIISSRWTIEQVLTLIQQIKQHLPALILTLKNKYANELKDKSIEEQEAYILQNVDSFRDMIVKNIEELKELVLSARPSSNTANEPNHEERKAAYRELLKLGTALMSKMQDTLNKIFDEYIKFLHEVRQVIRADNDPTPILNDFNRNIEIDFYSQMASQNYQKGISSTNPPQATNQQSYATKTLAIIEDQNQKRIPTLILKLQKEAPSSGNDELEQHINADLENFKRELLRNMEEFQQIVLSARPNPAMQDRDPTGYRNHADNYKQLLKLATGITKRMEESLNDILTQYEQYIENIWTAICQKQDVRVVQRQFDQAIKENMNRYWKPIFDSADHLIADINRMTRSKY
ncbi:unnamed protein product [Rotaria sp. Silwood1]|nr:unnamed protein product [Rotaria sp. Silwood1]